MRSLVFIALLFLSFALFTACSRTEAEQSYGPPERGNVVIPSVEVVRAQYGSLPLEKRLSGTVRAENQVVIYPEIAAPIVQVAAQDGDYVERGQPLVYLRDTQFREQLQQAEASLQVSRAEANRTEAILQELEARLKRTEELVEKQFQSTQDLEEIQAQVNAARATHQQALGRIAQAEAAVNEAQEALRRTVVRAPVSGYVGQRNAEIGMRVDTGTRLFMIGNLEKVRVEVAIPDEMIGRIKVGQTALISSPNLQDRVIRAKVSRISPFLAAGSYSAEAEIDVPNQERMLQPGMFVSVDILYGETEQATLIPLSSLYQDPDTGVLGVYVAPALGEEIPVEEPESFDADNPPPLLESTTLTFREINVLARGRDMVGVTGVQPGDWVVTVGQNLLSAIPEENPQARIRVIPWDRVADLQRLQDQDLLREFMAKQQRLARSMFNRESSGESDTTGSQQVLSSVD